MSEHPSLLIAGCGDIGCRLGERLAAAGWLVHGLRRNVAALPAAVLPVEGDLAEPTVPTQWPDATPDYVVYAAAASQHDEAGYRAAYVEGLRHLLGWLRQRDQKPRRLLFVSSTGVYAQHDGEWVDERSPAEPTCYTGRIMVEAERLALASGHPTSLVRMAGLYGPGSRWLIEQALQGYRASREPPLYANRIHRDDAAGLLATLLQADAQGEPLEDCYLGVDDTPAPLHEVIDWLRERLQVGDVPDQLLSRRAGSKRCSNARAVALGWRPAYPSYREGYAAMLD